MVVLSCVHPLSSSTPVKHRRSLRGEPCIFTLAVIVRCSCRMDLEKAKQILKSCTDDVSFNQEINTRTDYILACGDETLPWPERCSHFLIDESELKQTNTKLLAELKHLFERKKVDQLRKIAMSVFKDRALTVKPVKAILVQRLVQAYRDDVIIDMLPTEYLEELLMPVDAGLLEGGSRVDAGGGDVAPKKRKHQTLTGEDITGTSKSHSCQLHT
jgi:hypothetical protein